MGKWLTISEAVEVLGITERAVREKVKKDKIQSKLEKRRRYVWIEPHEVHHEQHHEIIQEKDARIEDLQRQVGDLQDQLARRDNQIESLTQQIDHLTQIVAMSQKTVATLSEQLESSRLMIEDIRKPLWRRIFKRD